MIGRLGLDPEVRYTPNGSAVTGFTLATSENWKDKNTGQKQEATEWHNVVIFGKLAEIAGKYLSKGSHVYIEGKIKSRKWQDKEGQDRYTTEIVLDSFAGVMQMLGGGRDSQQGQKEKPQQQAQVNPAQVNPAQAMNNNFDDDIPF